MLIHRCLMLMFILLYCQSTFGHGPEQRDVKSLKIGVLRHLTIEEAERLEISAEAEKMLIAEANARGHMIEFVNPLTLVYSTNSPRQYDVIISRAEIDDFNSHLTDSYFRALDYFSTQGIPVINSAKATLNAQDKFRTLMLAQNAGVRIPQTFVVHSPDAVESLIQNGNIHFSSLKRITVGAEKGSFR